MKFIKQHLIPAKSTLKRLSIILFFILLLAISVFKKIKLYSEDPQAEKDCPPLLPNPSDNNKSNTLLVSSGNLPRWFQKGGSINDASCLDKTSVYGIIQVRTISDIQNAIYYAKDHNLKIAIAGVKHSMGGQAFAKNAVVLDMTKYNSIKLNEKDKIITVQSGATWHNIQNYLHPKYAIKAMQSTDIFTVGGSISVNAHGMDHQAGSLGGTLRSITLIDSQGEIQKIDRLTNPHLFNLVIGGYGLFGVISEAEIDITENKIYESQRSIIDYKDFPKKFNEDILPNSKIELFYGHLSTA